MTEAGALEALVSQHVITAMKAHDAVRTTTLRLIKNALKNKAIEKARGTYPTEEQQALATMIKQRRDSIDQFTKGNRPELAAKEAAEIVVIEEFLPKALDEAALSILGRRSRRRNRRRVGPETHTQRDGPGHEGRSGQAASRQPPRRRPDSERDGKRKRWQVKRR